MLAKVENKPVNSVNSVEEDIVVQIVEVEEKLEKVEKKSEHSDKSKSESKDRDRKSSSSHKSSSSSSRSSSHKSSSSSHHKSSSSSSHKSKSSSSSSSSKDKDKDRDSKDKHRSSSSSSKHSSSSSSKSKDKEKSSQAEKDKDTLAKILPPTLIKLGKIPKKPSDGASRKSDGGTQKSTEDGGEKKEEKPPIKKSFSIEVRKGEKPKSVKTLNSQFRSHGLEEVPPPPSRKGVKRPGSSPTTNTPVVSSLKRSSPVPQGNKDVPPEKKVKDDLGVAPERLGGIKLIKPKRKYPRIKMHQRVCLSTFRWLLYISIGLMSLLLDPEVRSVQKDFFLVSLQGYI